MLCPICQKLDTQVIDTRDNGRIIKRRRKCPACNFRFTTTEQLKIPEITVIKRDKKKEPLQREKIKNGILKACEKRGISLSKIEKLVDKIIAKIYKKERKEIESKKIGEMVLEELKEFDPVAYLRFASVYRSFKSPQRFEKEIHKIIKE